MKNELNVNLPLMGIVFVVGALLLIALGKFAMGEAFDVASYLIGLAASFVFLWFLGSVNSINGLKRKLRGHASSRL